MPIAYAAPAAGAKLEAIDFARQALAKDEIRIQTEYCGICHSDLSMIDNEWGFSHYPLVAGHEIIGKVIELGADVAEFRIDQRVGLGWHAGYCLQCSYCKSGEHNLCAQAQPTVLGRYGGFAEEVTAKASAVVALPDGLDASKAGPLFCGGITVYHPLVEFGVRPQHKVAVIGIGGLGHLALKFARAWGCEVTAFTSSESKANEAKSLGAHHCVRSDIAEEIAAQAGKYDFILSTVNVDLDWNLYLSCLKPKGRLHFVGAATKPLDISLFSLLGGQKQISASPVGSPSRIAEMLEFCHRHGIEAQTESFSSNDINSAIGHLRSGKARYRVVLRF